MATPTYVDAPGAFPTTPSNELSSFQVQSSEQPTSTSSSRQYPTQQTAPDQATPRSLEDQQRSVDWAHQSSNSPLARQTENDKPGVMTGAFSRVGGTHPGTSTLNDNYTYGSKSNAQPSHDEDKGPTARNLATSGNPPSHSTASNPVENTTTNNTTNDTEDRNHIQTGLRGSSKTQHSEPYWGSIPQGAGVYNGVTGHGSNEPVPHHRSSHDQYNNTGNPSSHSDLTGRESHEPTSQQQTTSYDQYDPTKHSGIYNGVTGHGSNEPISTETSRRSRDYGSSDPYSQQRAFPLANSGETMSASTGLHDADEHKRDSRFKEGLAGAGAAAAGGYATHKYLNRDNENIDSNTTSRAPAGGKYDSHDQRKEIDVPHHGKEQNLPYRPLVSSSTQAEPRERTQALPQSTQQDHSSHHHPLHHKNDESNLGKYGAGAAAAGAGAYGAHKYANRNDGNEYSSIPENKTSYGGAGTRDMPSSELSRDTQQDPSRHHHLHHQKDDSNLAKYGAAAAATGAGAYGANKYANRDSANNEYGKPSSSQQPQYSSTHGALSSRDLPSSSVSHAKQSEHGKPVSSEQPHYNMLSDGTPSGIADTSVRSGAAVSDNSNTGEEYSSSGSGHKHASSAAGAGAGAAAAAGAAAMKGHQRNQHSTSSTGRLSTDSSRSGKYNVLSSGTPSGINLEHHRAEREEQRHEHEDHHEQPSSLMGNERSKHSSMLTNTSGETSHPHSMLGNERSQHPSMLPHNSRETSHLQQQRPQSSSSSNYSQPGSGFGSGSGAGIGTGAGAGALAGAGLYKKYAGESDHNSSARREAEDEHSALPKHFPSAAGNNDLSTGSESAYTSGQKMEYKCTSCGAMNDLSKHFRI